MKILSGGSAGEDDAACETQVIFIWLGKSDVSIEGVHQSKNSLILYYDYIGVKGYNSNRYNFLPQRLGILFSHVSVCV